MRRGELAQTRVAAFPPALESSVCRLSVFRSLMCAGPIG